MSADSSSATDAVRGVTPNGKARWLRWVIIVVAALFFAYDVFEGCANLIGTASTDIAPYLPFSVWVVIVASAVVPVLVFVIAVIVGRRARPRVLALMLAAALAANAAIALSLQWAFVMLVVGPL